MGKINVYLPDDLERAVRAVGLSVSAVCQTALQEAVTKLTRLRNTGDGGFTPHLAAIVEQLKADLAEQGKDVTARDLLCGILKHGDNLGARAMAAMGAELPPTRRTGHNNGDGKGELASDALDILVSAYKVALEMRHNYLGTEHVVIALAADGSPVREIFAGLGITDRLLRQQVERMIANPWTTEHAEPARSDADAWAHLEQEVQRLAAELGKLQDDDE